MIKVSSLIRCKVVGVVMWSGVLRVVIVFAKVLWSRVIHFPVRGLKCDELN